MPGYLPASPSQSASVSRHEGESAKERSPPLKRAPAVAGDQPSSTRSASQGKASSTAADKILAAYRKYRRQMYPQTAAFYDKVDNLSAPEDKLLLQTASVDPELPPERMESSAEPEKTVKKLPSQQGRNAPRYDRAGNLRPPNKRFLKRDIVTGKLSTPEAGKEDYTQLEEVQDWIKEKRHAKFDLIPEPSEFVFEDMDPMFLTEPNGLKNQGRRLLLGKNGTTEIWAVMPVSSRLYMPRLIQREGSTGPFTLFAKVREEEDEDFDMTNLKYPLPAFGNVKKLEEDWVGANTVIAYIFLLCEEATVVFSDSSKWPGQLSTALNRIKQVYAPYEPHPTAASIKAARVTIKRTEEDASASVTDISKRSEMDVIKEYLHKKDLLLRMEAMVSKPSVFVFGCFQAVVHVKNVQNVRNRALFMGESDNTTTWATLYRIPNKAQLGVIVNVDKKSGAQKVVQFFPDVPWALTFPFEAFRQKGDPLSFRKMQYVIGYIFLSMGEADKALNLTDAVLRHFTNITKMIYGQYGSSHPPEDLKGVFKPSTSPTGKPKSNEPDAPLASTSAKADNAQNPSKAAGESTKGASRNPLQEIQAPNGPQLSPPRRLGAALTSTAAPQFKIPPAPRRPIYTAPSTFRSLEDLNVSLFLEANLKQLGRRRIEDSREDRATKYLRIGSERDEATKLRVYQESVTEKAKLAVEEAQRVFNEEKRKIGLLQRCELDIVARQGEVSAAMTDDDIVKLPSLRVGKKT